MRKKSGVIAVVLLFGLCCLCGCRTPLEETPHQGAWTLSELENRAAGADPIEPFNRAMFSVQHILMEYPIDWIGRVYTSILPRPVVNAINNVCLNLEFPARAISCLLRAEWRGSWHELLRFLANSTLGIAGLFDVGKYWFDLYSTDSDFGQSFHAWGIDPGCTFILPFLPRVNVRDTVGFVFDCAFDAKTYIPYSSVVRLNQVIVAQEVYHDAVAGAGDPYKTYREGMTLRRELQNRLWFYHVGDRQEELFGPGPAPKPAPKEERKAASKQQGKTAPGEARKAAPEQKCKVAPAPVRKAVPPRPAPRGLRGVWRDLPAFGNASPVISSLRVVLWRPEKRNDWWYMPLSIFNSDFANAGRRIYVDLPNGGEVTCGFWNVPPLDYSDPGKVPPPPRLAVILPGVGGAYNGNSTLALAETFHKAGCAVLTFDCPFSANFMVQTGSGKLPGSVEQDARVLREVLARALDTLERKELIDLPEMTLVGYSFGGLYTLKIAEMEHRDPRLGFEHFIAVNPPVSLKYASGVADALNRAGEGWSAKKAVDALTETTGRIMTASTLKAPPADYGAMPLFQPGEERGAFLAGLFFRLPLRHILFHAWRQGMPLPLKTPYSWWRRNGLYLEADRVGFGEYAAKFAAPFYRGLSPDELYAQGDLRNFRGLGRIPGVRVFHTWDDPLLAPEHRRFLDRTFGSRLVWFSRGGHLGNLYLPEVNKEILRAVIK